MTSRIDPVRLGWLAAAALAGLVALPALLAPLSQTTLYDGGITASAGTFIAHGRLPYRDFWLLYGPLTGYLAAASTLLLGVDILVLRGIGLLLVMVTSAIGYGLVGDRVPVIPRVTLASIAALVPVYHVGLDLAPWTLSLMLAMAAILVIRGGGSRALFVAGVLVGLASLARLDVGAYALIAIVIASRSWRPILGAAIVVAPVAIFFLLVVPIDALVEQLIWYPIVGPRVYRGIPAPDLSAAFAPGGTVDWLLYWAPLALIVLAIVRRLRTGVMSPTDLALLILAILCRLQTLGRADAIHDAEAAVPAILLAAYVFSGMSSRVGRVSVAMGAAVFIALAALPLVWLVQPKDPYDDALRAAVAYVRENSAPNEPIFAGEASNRYALLNPLIAYYLADRPPGVRDTMYNPGVTTTESTQRRMVDDLRSNGVRLLILDVRSAGCYETANLSREPGASVLDDALGQDYRVVADFGAVVIMGPRDERFAKVPARVWADPAPPPDRPYFTCQRSTQQP
jgi:hypothetical protein